MSRPRWLTSKTARREIGDETKARRRGRAAQSGTAASDDDRAR